MGENVQLAEDGSGGITLQDRDIEIFRMIHEQGFMAQNQVKACFWPETTGESKTYQQRLFKLKEHGYLSEASSKLFSFKCFLITEKALGELKARKLDSGLGLYEAPFYFEKNYQHGLNVNNLRIVFRGIGLGDWESERYLKEVKKVQFVPDGVIRYLGFRFAVELEMTQKEHARYERRFEYFRKNPDYKLVFIVLHDPRLIRLMRLNYKTSQVWFVSYQDLMEKKKEVIFENKSGNFRLARILGASHDPGKTEGKTA